MRWLTARFGGGSSGAKSVVLLRRFVFNKMAK